MFLNFLLAFIIHFHDSIIMNLPKMNFKPTDIVVVCLSGRGDKDLATYMSNIKM